MLIGSKNKDRLKRTILRNVKISTIDCMPLQFIGRRLCLKRWQALSY